MLNAEGGMLRFKDYVHGTGRSQCGGMFGLSAKLSHMVKDNSRNTILSYSICRSMGTSGGYINFGMYQLTFDGMTTAKQARSAAIGDWSVYAALLWNTLGLLTDTSASTSSLDVGNNREPALEDVSLGPCLMSQLWNQCLPYYSLEDLEDHIEIPHPAIYHQSNRLEVQIIRHLELEECDPDDVSEFTWVKASRSHRGSLSSLVCKITAVGQSRQGLSSSK
ncbi:hypothetical protein B0H10DRAFT_1959119 [Mycena sp. CBHHK59/15]|nr:hypothetical protein B0H10DRAFT_1959119 [Mycena sp. CBHHK59/15]